jgi:hypothetical protein
MSLEYGLQELVIDSSHDRVRSGFWCWKPADGSHAMYKSDSHYNNARLLRLSDNEIAGNLVVVKKRDAVGHFHDYYYLRPVENATDASGNQYIVHTQPLSLRPLSLRPLSLRPLSLRPLSLQPSRALSLSAPELFPFGPTEDDEPTGVRPVPVTVIFLDLFGERRAHFSVSRQAFFDNPDVLYDRIEQFLMRDSETSLQDVSAIRAEASDDAGFGVYAPSIVYSLAALSAGVLDQPRAVDLGLARNREMNVREYIRQQLQHLLRVDMLGMSAAMGMRVPECHWTLCIAARDVRLTHNWHWRRRQ